MKVRTTMLAVHQSYVIAKLFSIKYALLHFHSVIQSSCGGDDWLTEVNGSYIKHHVD